MHAGQCHAESCCSQQLLTPLGAAAAMLLVMQVTHHQLDQMRESEASARAAEAKERELAAKREVSAVSYTKLVDTENVNRVEDAGGWVL